MSIDLVNESRMVTNDSERQAELKWELEILKELKNIDVLIYKLWRDAKTISGPPTEKDKLMLADILLTSRTMLEEIADMVEDA